MKKLFTLAFIAVCSASANAQVMNGGLEDWTTYTSDTASLIQPNHWYGSDSLTYGLASMYMLEPAQQVFREDNNVNTGDHAAKLVSHDVGSLVGVAPGIIANGKINIDGLSGEFSFIGGTSVTEKVAYIHAMVDYQPQGADVGAIFVQAVMEGQGVNGTDSVIGTGTLSIDGTSGYENMGIAIDYINQVDVPDLIQIAFFSSEEIGSGEEGSTMYVDDVSLTLASTVNNVVKAAGIKCFPNPVNDGVLNITNTNKEKLTLNVVSATGQLVNTMSFSGNTQVSLSALTNGMYFVNISDAAGQVIKSEKLMLNK